MKKSKAARIRSYIAAGKTPKQVAELVGVTPQYVHGILHIDRKKAGLTKRGPGRPKKISVLDPSPVGEWTLTAQYTPPRLTWKQRFSALFLGRV